MCGAGNQSFHIDPYGMLSLCIVARTPSYSLRLGRFHEAWSGFLAEVRQTQQAENYQCTQCDLRSLCAQCPAVAMLETGDPEQPVSYLCEVTHLRAEAFMTKSMYAQGQAYPVEVRQAIKLPRRWKPCLTPKSIVSESIRQAYRERSEARCRRSCVCKLSGKRRLEHMWLKH